MPDYASQFAFYDRNLPMIIKYKNCIQSDSKYIRQEEMIEWAGLTVSRAIVVRRLQYVVALTDLGKRWR